MIVCLLAAVAGLFLYLNVVFAGRSRWAGLVPTGASLHHLTLLVSRRSRRRPSMRRRCRAPTGIVLLTVAGIGIVAAFTDLLAVRLHRPAIAGLPLLVLFCVPLTTDARPGGVGETLVFCAGIVGYLGLLSADGRDRLRLWGRLIHPWQDERKPGGPTSGRSPPPGGGSAPPPWCWRCACRCSCRACGRHRLFPGLVASAAMATHGPLVTSRARWTC